MNEPRPRTSEEREAARREREARRRARAEGGPEPRAVSDGGSRPSLKLPSVKLPSIKLPQLFRGGSDGSEPDRDERPEPPPRSVVSRPPPTASPATSARPPARVPKRQPVERPEARPPTRRLPRPGDAAPGDAAPPAGSADGQAHDEPQPLRRRAPLPTPGAAAPPSAGAPQGDLLAAMPDPAPRRRVGRRLAILGGVAALLGLVALWFLVSLFQPFHGEGEGEVRLTIPTGTGIGEAADLLEEKGVIGSAFFFKLRARTTGQGGDIKQGTFNLKRDMSYTAALDAITTAPKANVVNVTVPEGRSRREVAPIVRSAGIDGSYTRASRRSTVLNPRGYGAKRASSLEGFLFPSTYELKKGTTARGLVREQLETFKREFRKVDMRTARRRNLTPYDVLIIASMVDRETLLARERRIVSSVIHNRLREGIPLGIDATIRFATGNWTRPLRQSELAIASPYNTRENQGLPPGPIGSPGLDSIEAAANPARTKFLYYVVKPGTCGEHAFSRTDAQFQRDSERYNSAREAAGGKSPDTCEE